MFDLIYFLQGEPGLDAILILFGFGAVLLWVGFREYKKHTLVRNTPTSRIRSMPIGLVEIKGKTKKHQGALRSPLLGEECVAYIYEVEEWDSDDDKWDTVRSEKQSVPFYVEDETGRVLVEPTNAEFDLPDDIKIDDGDVSRDKYVDADPDVLDLLRRGGRRRYTESYIGLDQDVYILGRATRNPDAASSQSEENLVIKKDKETDMFLISDSSEKDLASKSFWLSIILVLVGTGMLIWGFAMVLSLLNVI